MLKKTQIERWYNIEKRPCSEIAKLLNKKCKNNTKGNKKEG